MRPLQLLGGQVTDNQGAFRLRKSVQTRRVIGGGPIGKRHIEHLIAEPLVGIIRDVDPGAGQREMAKTKELRW